MAIQNRIFSSLVWRLTAWYSFAAFMMILMIAVISYYALVSAFTNEMDSYLRDTAEQLQDHITKRGLKFVVEEELPSRSYMRTFSRVLDEKGALVSQTAGMQKFLPLEVFPPAIELTEDLNGIDYFSQLRGRTLRLMSVQVMTPHRLTIQLACDRKREAGILKRYKVTKTIVLSLSLLLCVVGGFFIAKRGIQPVSSIARTTEQIGHGTLHERIALEGLPDELAQLAKSFNAMLDRLQESFARISQFSEDIAHELRTPVNNLRGGMEVVLGKPRSPDDYRDAIGSALEECERLARLVDRLLFIARSEHSDGKIEYEVVSLRQELLNTQEFYEVNAEESRVTITVDAPANLTTKGNRDLLRSLIGNLVSNALAHTPPGGTVQLIAADVNHHPVITVRDSGKGIPPEHLPHIFDRFYRVDRSRTKTSGGVGLGLAIVNTIAKLHSASLNIESTVGKGTAISVTFPKD